jgi:hypothetical protein
MGAGKKDKVNKVAIVGVLRNKEGEKRRYRVDRSERFFFFCGGEKIRGGPSLQTIKKDGRIKNKKVKIDIAR